MALTTLPCATMLSCEHYVVDIVFDVTIFRDDRNLLYSDISLGDEVKPN
jgi:hypothetical protein